MTEQPLKVVQLTEKNGRRSGAVGHVVHSVVCAVHAVICVVHAVVCVVHAVVCVVHVALGVVRFLHD